MIEAIKFLIKRAFKDDNDNDVFPDSGEIEMGEILPPFDNENKPLLIEGADDIDQDTNIKSSDNNND